MKRYFCLFGALMLGGCVSMKSVPASVDLLKAHQGQNFTIVTHQRPNFVAMSQNIALSNSAFGVVGALVALDIATKHGNKIVEENGIPDPALDISAKLSPMLRDELKPSAVKTLTDVDTKVVDEGTLAQLAGQSGLVFDVQTVHWQFVFFPFSVHYRILVAVQARLIDANTDTSIAQAPCDYRSEVNPPTYDQMLDDHAALLKSMLLIATNTCAATMQKGLFGIEGAG